MENNIDIVNDALFDTLKKLQTKQIDIPTAKAIVATSDAIVKNAALQLQAFKMTKGQIAAPKALTSSKIFLTKGSDDVHAQKTEYAQSLGFKDVTEAIGKLGSYDFNKRFKEEFAQ